MAASSPLRVDLYVRADAPIADHRREVIDTLARFERERRIDGFAVHPWPSSMSLDLAKEAGDDSIAGVVRSFERWAEDAGVSVHPPFDVRQTRSKITDETDETLVLPVFCLAAYEGGDLIGVYPCCSGDSVVTVDDALTTIEVGGRDLLRPSAGEGQRTSEGQSLVSQRD